MGDVIRMDVGKVHKAEPAVRKRPVRRSTDPRDRAPVTVDTAGQHIASVVVFPGEAAQAAAMRRHLRMIVSRPMAENAVVESLASELFNNAITHSRSGQAGGEVTVAVIRSRGRVQVKVTDAGPRPGRDGSPHLRAVDLDREGGFGLRLVAAEASRWGTVHEGGRTTVWFDLDRPGAAG